MKFRVGYAVLTLLLAASRAGHAAITNVQITGTTSLQAILTYTAPGANACTLRVSENANFIPLAHAVDPALFTGSNTDAGGAVDRVWVIGRRGAPVASDGKRYSLALQCNTKHYFELTCGSDVAAGNFTTSNIPIGKTFAEPIPQ